MFKGKISILFYLSIAVIIASQIWERFFVLNFFYRDLAAFAGLVGFAVWAAINISRIRKGEGFKKFKRGTGSIISILLVGAILVVLNFLSFNNGFRIDVTRSGAHSLSDETKKILTGLNKSVIITGFFQEGAEAKNTFQALLKEYSYCSKMITFRLVDPDKQPAEAKRYGISQYNTIVVESAGVETKINTITEESFTNAIVKVTRRLDKSICFVTGHGEKNINSSDSTRDGYSIVKNDLVKANYKVEQFSLYSSNKVPDNCTILVIAGPSMDYTQQEVDVIQKFLETGGKLLIMIDPFYSGRVLQIAETTGIIFRNDVIADENAARIIGGDVFTSAVNRYSKHPATAGFQPLTFFPLARSVGFSQPAESGRKESGAKNRFEELLYTSSSSWIEEGGSLRPAFDPSKDKKGPACIGGVFYGTMSGKDYGYSVIAIGDSDFASNAYIGLSGNMDLFMNCVNWLADEGDLIFIKTKHKEFSSVSITRTEGNIIFIVSVIAIPCIILVTGTFIWIRRKKL